jgi:peptidoglycan/xylan/chitin deacetylase (PgdA/CDA1 family)
MKGDMRDFRVFIFSAMAPAQLHHLLRRLRSDLPEVVISGIFQQAEPALIEDNGRRRITGRIVNRLRQSSAAACHRLLHWFHATPGSLDKSVAPLQELEVYCAKNCFPFQLRREKPGKASSRCIPKWELWNEGWREAEGHDRQGIIILEVEAADLVIIYGPVHSELKISAQPCLGFVTAHHQPVVARHNDDLTWPTRKIVRVHRLSDDGQVGTEPYATPTSMALKAQLLAIDCLIEIIRAASISGQLPEKAIAAEPSLDKNELVQNGTLELNGICPVRRFKPVYTRPWYKLAPRMLVYPALRMRNRKNARQKSYPVVILFHHLVTDRTKGGSIPTAQFLRHVHFLKRHYKIASLPEALNMLKNGEVPASTVVLTFDDGYEENFLGLRAVAEAENIPITLFVCTRTITDRRAFQHDLDRGEHGFHPLTWDQVRYLDRHQVTIGSHTQTHFDCASTDLDLLEREIAGSQEDLRRELGHEILYFSFPKGKSGNMSEAAKNIAGRTYPYLFSACGGVNTAPWVPGNILKRCYHPASLFELELLMQSVLNFENPQ